MTVLAAFRNGKAARKLAKRCGYCRIIKTNLESTGEVYLASHSRGGKRACTGPAFLIVNNGIARFAAPDEHKRLREQAGCF